MEMKFPEDPAGLISAELQLEEAEILILTCRKAIKAAATLHGGMNSTKFDTLEDITLQPAEKLTHLELYPARWGLFASCLMHYSDIKLSPEAALTSGQVGKQIDNELKVFKFSLDLACISPENFGTPDR